MINPLLLPQNYAVFGLANPFAVPDHQIAAWFHAHMTGPLGALLKILTELGSGRFIGVVLFFTALLFIWKRWWPSLVTLIVAVPGGMLLNEWVKVLVQRQRPFLEGSLVDWSGYSFASGHTIGATLLYGQFLLFILPAMKARHWRVLTIFGAALVVAMVGFSRIALGAHFLTDVVAAIVFGIIWLTLCLIIGKPMRRNSGPYLPIVEPLPIDAAAVLVPVEQIAQPVRIPQPN